MIKARLSRFEKVSGQRVNYVKSYIFFSSKVNEESTKELSRVAGMDETAELGRYHARLIHQDVARSYI